MSRTPPSRKRTAAARSLMPSRCAATNAAQAPVPQALVRPAPRSHTRIVIRSRARFPVVVSLSMQMTSTFVCSGNNG